MAGSNLIVDDSANPRQALLRGAMSACLVDAAEAGNLTPACTPFDLVLSDIDLEESAEDANPISN